MHDLPQHHHLAAQPDDDLIRQPENTDGVKVRFLGEELDFPHIRSG